MVPQVKSVHQVTTFAHLPLKDKITEPEEAAKPTRSNKMVATKDPIAALANRVIPSMHQSQNRT